MSFIRLALACALSFAFLPPAQARENPYDVVGKVLGPFTQVIAGSTKTKNRAISMEIHIEQSDDDPKLVGTHVRIALEMPERLRVTAPMNGETVTVVRDGQKIWAYPGSRLKALIADPQVAKSLPEPDKKFKLAPFELPIPEKQLAFLPVLFQVAEAPDESVDGVPCRVLDLRLQKDLAKSLQFQGAKARIWVGPEYRLMRLAGQSEQGDATLRFDELTFRPAMPPETWQPTAEESADVLTLSPSLYDQLVRALMGRGKN